MHMHTNSKRYAKPTAQERTLNHSFVLINVKKQIENVLRKSSWITLSLSLIFFVYFLSSEATFTKLDMQFGEPRETIFIFYIFLALVLLLQALQAASALELL